MPKSTKFVSLEQHRDSIAVAGLVFGTGGARPDGVAGRRAGGSHGVMAELGEITRFSRRS